MIDDDVALDALDRLRGTGPEYHDFFANHGPMAADALARLGAVDAVPGWVDRYRTRLRPAPEVTVGLAAEDWRRFLGRSELLGDWVDLMRQEARERPWRELLLRWWPRLLPGMAASATHGVIRTGHAVRRLLVAGDRPHPLLVDELAQGLALWATRYLPLPGSPSLAGSRDAVSALARLPRLTGPDGPVEGGALGRLGALATVDGYTEGLDGWRAPADPDQALDELIGAAARVLCAREDAGIVFCHAVTGPAAVRLILPALPDALHRPSVAVTWQVVGAFVGAFGTPRLPAESHSVDGPSPTPERLAALAAEHGDEHVIKLTEAAVREYSRTGDPALLVAADRYRGRLAAASSN